MRKIFLCAVTLLSFQADCMGMFLRSLGVVRGARVATNVSGSMHYSGGIKSPYLQSRKNKAVPKKLQKWLEKYQLDGVNGRNNHDETSLICALTAYKLYDAPDLVKLINVSKALIKCGADVNEHAFIFWPGVSWSGTALHHFFLRFYSNDEDCIALAQEYIQLLCDAGFQINTLDDNGNTSLDLFAQSYFPTHSSCAPRKAIIETLRKNGAQFSDEQPVWGSDE